MFNLGDVFQFIIDCFYQGPFSQQDFIRYAHQGIFHIVLHFGYQLYAVKEEVLEQGLPNISLVRTELAFYVLQEFFSVSTVHGHPHCLA